MEQVKPGTGRVTDYWVTIERRIGTWVPRARGHGQTKQAAWEDALAVWDVTYDEQDEPISDSPADPEPQQDADEGTAPEV